MLEVSPCDSSVFHTLPLSPCALFPLSYMDSLDHQHCGCRPRPAFPFATVPIISFILRANSAFSTATQQLHFWLVITEGWVFFTSGSQESRSIWKSRTFPNLYSSTSDNVGGLIYRWSVNHLVAIFLGPATNVDQ